MAGGIMARNISARRRRKYRIDDVSESVWYITFGCHHGEAHNNHRGNRMVASSWRLSAVARGLWHHLVAA